jgi:hypothetical protein
VVGPAVPDRPPERPPVGERPAGDVGVPAALLGGTVGQVGPGEAQEVVGGSPPARAGGGSGSSTPGGHGLRGRAGAGHRVTGRAAGRHAEAPVHAERLEHALDGERLEALAGRMREHEVDHRPHGVGVREAPRLVHERQRADPLRERRERLAIVGQDVDPPAQVRHQRARRLVPRVAAALLARGRVEIELAPRGRVEHQRGRHRLRDRARAELGLALDGRTGAHDRPLLPAQPPELRARHTEALAPLAQRERDVLEH